MTPYELAVLRDRVARARFGLTEGIPPHVVAQRERWRADAALRRAKYRYRCVYCGDRLRDKAGRFGKRLGLACPKHADLPAVDPKYATATMRAAA